MLLYLAVSTTMFAFLTVIWSKGSLTNFAFKFGLALLTIWSLFEYAIVAGYIIKR